MLSEKTMKRMAAVILFCFLAFCLSGCVTDPNIPSGYTGKEEHFDKEGFQDYADYCKYFYKDAAAFENNPDYRKVTERDIAGIKEYFDYFEMCMDGGRADEYDFDTGCMTSGDYVSIKTKEGISDGNIVYGKLDNYNIYYFDTDSNILYYIHNNI